MRFTLWKDNQRTEAKPFGMSLLNAALNFIYVLNDITLEIGIPILPRFFLVTTQSGVKSMSLTLDGARERLFNHNHSVVECAEAIWTYRYHNGYTIALRGPLTAHVIVTPALMSDPQSASKFLLRFEEFVFEARHYDKFLSLESIKGNRSPRHPLPPQNGIVGQDVDKRWDEPRIRIDDCELPGEPVNAFGIPQATMRCLEVRRPTLYLPCDS